MEEQELLEQKDLRNEMIVNIEVLDKVGDLLLLPNTEKATIKQVAQYYNATEDAIKKVIQRNMNEFVGDGYKHYNKKELIDFYERQGQNVTNVKREKTKTIISFKEYTDLHINNTGLSLFTKRAMLRVGMLLRDSEIAKEVRTRLLDIVHDVGKENPEIINNIINEMNDEKQLIMDRVEAEISGDYPKVCEINSKIFALKNKRIQELEDENEIIKTHALTIIESRNVINRLVKTISAHAYNNKFGIAYNDLYSKINYKLGINIKARTKKKNESYLNTLSEQETFDTEQIVRSWAVDEGLDVQKLLKLGK